MLVVPPVLSQEEETLQQKFNTLKKKKKRALLGPRKPRRTASQRGAKRSLSEQRVVDAAAATQQAKQLVKSGAIRATKAATKNSGFKRPCTLERKLKDPKKGPVPTLQPFQRRPCAQGGLQESPGGPRRKSPRESPVSSRDRLGDLGRDGERAEGSGAAGGPPRSFHWGYEERGATCSKVSPPRRPDRGHERNQDRSRERNRDPSRERNPNRDPKRDRDRDREGPFRRSDRLPERRAPREARPLSECGEDLTPTLLRGPCSPVGNVTDLSVDPPRTGASLTHDKVESADPAAAELHGTQVEPVQLPGSIARAQPLQDAATGKSVWRSLAAQGSPEDCHRDKRPRIVHSDDGHSENRVGGF